MKVHRCYYFISMPLIGNRCELLISFLLLITRLIGVWWNSVMTAYRFLWCWILKSDLFLIPGWFIIMLKFVDIKAIITRPFQFFFVPKTSPRMYYLPWFFWYLYKMFTEEDIRSVIIIGVEKCLLKFKLPDGWLSSNRL